MLQLQAQLVLPQQHLDRCCAERLQSGTMPCTRIGRLHSPPARSPYAQLDHPLVQTLQTRLWRSLLDWSKAFPRIETLFKLMGQKV